jgi:hypothetical protein
MTLPALLLTAALAADAEPNAEPLPNAFSLYMSLIEPSIPVQPSTFFNGQTATSVSTAVRLGATIGGRHALLVGLGFQATPGSQQFEMSVSVMPTYRFFLRTLRPGGFSPFFELMAFFGVTYIPSQGMNGTTIPFGGGIGFGGEYLLARNVGLAASMGMRLTHSPAQLNTGAPEGNTLDLRVSLAIAFHF